MVGMRGKVIPLGLIKKTYFPEDLAKIQELLRKADDAAAAIQDSFENLSDDAKEAIVKDDDESKYELKKIKAAISLQSTSPPTTSPHSGSCYTRSTPRKPTRKRPRPPTPNSRKRPKPKHNPSPTRKSTTCSKRPGSPL